jgi:hypothetical protein
MGLHRVSNLVLLQALLFGRAAHRVSSVCTSALLFGWAPGQSPHRLGALCCLGELLTGPVDSLYFCFSHQETRHKLRFFHLIGLHSPYFSRVII